MRFSRWLSHGLLALGAAGTVVIAVAATKTEQRIAALDARSRTVETRHGTIEYERWGEGPPVLVIHGAGGGFDQGRLLAENMVGEGFQWISVSRFGYLRSDLPEDGSAAAQAEAFADVLDQIGIDRICLLAVSGGVPPALKFAEIFPDRTDCLVLLAAAPFTPFHPNAEQRPVPGWVYSALFGNDIVYWVLTKVARGALATAFDARPDLREGLSQTEAVFVEQLIDGFLPASRRLAGVDNEGAAIDPRARYDVEAIAAPVLIVHARDDHINSIAIGEALAHRLPVVTFMAVDTGGHLLLGHHEALKELLSGFLIARRED